MPALSVSFWATASGSNPVTFCAAEATLPATGWS